MPLITFVGGAFPTARQEKQDIAFFPCFAFIWSTKITSNLSHKNYTHACTRTHSLPNLVGPQFSRYSSFFRAPGINIFCVLLGSTTRVGAPPTTLQAFLDMCPPEPLWPGVFMAFPEPLLHAQCTAHTCNLNHSVQAGCLNQLSSQGACTVQWSLDTLTSNSTRPELLSPRPFSLFYIPHLHWCQHHLVKRKAGK